MKLKSVITLVVIMLLIAVTIAYYKNGCGGNSPLPKPHGYFRIDLPQKGYTSYQSKCPIAFDIPNYARVELFRDKESADSCWFNIVFPRLNATVYCTYLPIHNNFDQLIGDAYEFAAKHEMKASGLRRTSISNDASKVYGIVYDIEGEAASQLQFFLTDSASHFFRGSLYFNSSPNPDSIAPVLAFLRQDIMEITKSLRWKTAD